MSTPQPISEITDMTKSFPGIKALNYTSPALMTVEVIALLGQNRAGKTIMNMTYMEIGAEYSRAVAQPGTMCKLQEGNQ